MFQRLKADESGMTLIEITIVIVILGLLAALILPQFGGVLDDAKITTAQSEIRMFENALQRFEINVGDFPTTEQGLRSLWRTPDTEAENWKGPYIQKPKFKDPWKSEYLYIYPGNHEGYAYDLYSLGKDGKESDDDITSWIEGTE